MVTCFPTIPFAFLVGLLLSRSVSHFPPHMKACIQGCLNVIIYLLCMISWIILFNVLKSIIVSFHLMIYLSQMWLPESLQSASFFLFTCALPFLSISLLSSKIYLRLILYISSPNTNFACACLNQPFLQGIWVPIIEEWKLKIKIWVVFAIVTEVSWLLGPFSGQG